jgi:hypothetical protein
MCRTFQLAGGFIANFRKISAPASSSEREGTGARGVGSVTRGRARLVDRLFTPLRAQRALLDACFLGDWTIAERCSFVLFMSVYSTLLYYRPCNNLRGRELREILPPHESPSIRSIQPAAILPPRALPCTPGTDALDVAHPLEVVVLLGHALEAVHRRVALGLGDARLPLQPRILLQQRAHARVRLGRVGAWRRRRAAARAAASGPARGA